MTIFETHVLQIYQLRSVTNSTNVIENVPFIFIQLSIAGKLLKGGDMTVAIRYFIYRYLVHFVYCTRLILFQTKVNCLAKITCYQTEMHNVSEQCRSIYSIRQNLISCQYKSPYRITFDFNL